MPYGDVNYNYIEFPSTQGLFEKDVTAVVRLWSHLETLDEMPPARHTHTNTRKHSSIQSNNIIYVWQERLIERLGNRHWAGRLGGSPAVGLCKNADQDRLSRQIYTRMR
jgi:hypothetical protein